MSDAPRLGEWEITLLGRGVGESIVVHTGNGRWIIIDSFMYGDQPAARFYLDGLGVTPEQVRDIVITHFHADHYRGILPLHAYYRVARLVYTGALSERNLSSLVGAGPGRKKLLEGLPETLRRAKQRNCEGRHGRRKIIARSDLAVSGEFHIKALAPTDAAVGVSDEELAEVIATRDVDLVNQHLRDDNRSSIVLHIKAAEFAALLGGDLVAEPAEYGWPAVVSNPDNEVLSRSSYVKVPHHGSEGAHHPEMWTMMVEADAILTVSPYWPSGIPDDDDVQRLVGLGRELWQSVASTAVDAAQVASASRERDEFGNSTSEMPFGVIRARRREESQWEVQAFGPAFRHGDVATEPI